MKTYKGLITKLESNQIMVFGSNPQGRHGAGAALWALKNAGAIYGKGDGMYGQSYAIPTKDLDRSIHPSILPIQIIEKIAILYFVATNADRKLEYLIGYSALTPDGKKDTIYLSGYTPKQMAAMFSLARFHTINNKIPDNIIFEVGFSKLIY